MNFLLGGLILIVTGGFICDQFKMLVTGIPLVIAGFMCFLAGFVSVLFTLF